MTSAAPHQGAAVSTETPLFSIVTITKENARGLELTLDSIAKQTCRDFELIIVDADSRDDTREVVSRYRAMVTHFTSEPDRGIAHAFNKGTSAARGRLVNYLNAGDRYSDESALVRVAEFYAEQGPFSWAYGLPIRCDEQGRRFPPLPLHQRAYDYAAFSRGAMLISHQAAFFATSEVRELGGYDEAFQCQAMDYDLMLRFAMRTSPKAIDSTLVVYDVTGRSARSNLQGLLAKHAVRVRRLRLSPILRWFDWASAIGRYLAGRVRHAIKATLLLSAPGRKLLRASGRLH